MSNIYMQTSNKKFDIDCAREVVSHLLSQLISNLYTVLLPDDEWDMERPVDLNYLDHDEALNEIFAADSAELYIRGRNGARGWILIIPENGYEVISDCSYNKKEIDKLIDATIDHFNSEEGQGDE